MDIGAKFGHFEWPVVVGGTERSTRSSMTGPLRLPVPSFPASPGSKPFELNQNNHNTIKESMQGTIPRSLYEPNTVAVGRYEPVMSGE